MTEQEQETLEECIDRIDAIWARDRQTRLVHTQGHDRTLVLEETQKLAKGREHFLALLHFAQTCNVVISKTKVLRVRGSSNRGAFQHKGRFVMPNIALVSGEKKIVIEYLDDVKDFDDRTGQVCLPHIYARWGGISLGSQWDKAASYYRFTDDLAKAFKHSAGAHWQEVCQQVRDEWKKVETNLDQLVDKQFEIKGNQERREFQLKLMSMLGKTKGLIDASPEAVFEIFKLGYDDIEKLARFTSRNKADIGLITLDDVKTAQDEARVKSVMES